MKKYLFGLGAMLVGAGLMFVLMHGEVSADSKPKVVCEETVYVEYFGKLTHCKFDDVTCVTTNAGISCVKN